MDLERPRICVSICERSIDALATAIAGAARAADLIEIRLDCIAGEDLKSSFDQINQLLSNSSIPAILTFRPAEQGGASDSSYEARRAFWKEQGLPSPHLCDLEIDVAEQFAREAVSSRIDWSRVICSYHDFAGGHSGRGVLDWLAGLDQIYKRLSASPAGILKIAVQADDAIDCLPVFQLLERGRREGREIIAIAMGTPGIATRILGPSRGAFLTYAALENETATAPGQITARELREIYRIEGINLQTKIFGLIGQPVSHSVSPQMHNAAFAAAGAKAVYLPFEVRDIKRFIGRMTHPRTRELDWEISGLSVTAPHKTAVMEHLDWIAPAAREIGAVNTIVVAEGLLHGYNTDAVGFLKPLIQKFGPLQGARCAVIGAGGAASAAIWGLKQEAAEVTIYARDINKAEALAGKFGGSWEGLRGARFAGLDLVINATPLGTADEFENQTPATAQQLSGARLAYDLVYNPTGTRFLGEAREAGCETLGGLPMLVAQAAEQYRLWTGTSAPEDVMHDAAQRGLFRSEI
ncbi:MAG: shikimate dehydrogenase [Acidobacteriota bacterium]|nr:shikimate dehydrogenase [Acidobacteriota bacterium]